MVPNRKTVRSLDALPIAGTSDDRNRGFTMSSFPLELSHTTRHTYFVSLISWQLCQPSERSFLQKRVHDCDVRSRTRYAPHTGSLFCMLLAPFPQQTLPLTHLVIQRLPSRMRGKGSKPALFEVQITSRLGGKLFSTSSSKDVRSWIQAGAIASSPLILCGSETLPWVARHGLCER
jgi:hypothetical protein